MKAGRGRSMKREQWIRVPVPGSGSLRHCKRTTYTTIVAEVPNDMAARVIRAIQDFAYERSDPKKSPGAPMGVSDPELRR